MSVVTFHASLNQADGGGGIEPAQDFNRRFCVAGEDTLACASVREGRP